MGGGDRAIGVRTGTALPSVRAFACRPRVLCHPDPRPAWGEGDRTAEEEEDEEEEDEEEE